MLYSRRFQRLWLRIGGGVGISFPALMTLAIAFVAHALVDIAHRPGWLSPAIAPQRFIAGCAAYDVYVAALCFWARGR